MAEESVEVSEKVSVGNEDVGASAGAEAHAGVEVTDSSVSAEAGVSAGAEAHERKFFSKLDKAIDSVGGEDKK